MSEEHARRVHSRELQDGDHSHGSSNALGNDHGGRGHVHAPTDFGRAFAIGIVLNTAFVVAEAVFGYVGNSTALLADAGHNLSDILGLVVAWAASVASKRAPRGRFTYGMKGTSILAALANGVFLLVATGAIGWEAVLRFSKPEPVAGVMVMVVAAIGIAVNGATAMLFARGRKGDINIQGAFLHMAADAAVSAGVVVAGGLFLWTGQLWLDPAMSLVICAVILWSTWGLLRGAVTMSLSAAPAGTDLNAVRALLLRRPGVAKIHDLHVWSISTTESAITCHLVMPAGHPGDDFLIETARLIRSEHGIGHATLQIEVDDDNACELRSDLVV